MPGQTLEVLTRALRGLDPTIAPEQAALMLARSRRGVLVLSRTLSSHEPDSVRRSAAYGLTSGELKNEELNVLLRVFRNASESPSLRGQAAEALAGRIAYGTRRRRRDVLAQFAFVRGLDDPEPEVRLWSIFALADGANGWLIPKLNEMAEDTTPVPNMWTVGQEARWAINWIKGYEDVDPSEL